MNAHTLTIVACLAAAWLTPLTAQDAADKPAAQGGTSGVPRITFERYTLPNGLQVILHVDRKLPMVHVNQWYHVGSKNERVGRSGFAHLFEHMMFEGSQHAKGNYFSYAERAGANLFEGGVNGTTDWDRTNYFVTAPSANLEMLLWLESDRLATLADALTQERLNNQRDVVKNERRQGLENQPYGRAFKLIFENAFPFHHPYANDVIGSHEDLTAATLDDVKEFFHSYYTPNNLSLAITGDIDIAGTKRLVEKYFGGIPAGPALDRPVRFMPPLEGQRIVETKDRVPQERTYFAWLSPAFFDPGDADLELASLILTDGLSSRLNKVLVYDKQLCSDVSSFQGSAEAAGLFVSWATARPGASLSQIEQIVTDEIARLAASGPSAAELNRAKEKWEYQYVTGLERIGGFGGKADRLNAYNTFLGDPGKFDADVQRHRETTVESVRGATAKWLNTPDRVLVRFHPETSSREVASSLDRSKEPPLGADRPFLAPEVSSTKLKNGMEIYVVSRPELPKVAVTLATRAGSVYDPPGKEGLADMVASTLIMGTPDRNALQIQDQLGDLGTSINGTSDYERTTVSLEVLKKNLGPAVMLLAAVARTPRFPDSEIDREKKRRLDALSQEMKEPNAIALRVGEMLAFGAQHPYGRPVRGLPSTVQALTRDDFARFHEAYWKPASSALLVAGDITLTEAQALAEERFGDWTGAAPAPPAVPAPNPMGVGKVYLVDRQDAAQTVVLQLLPGPKRKSADYYPLQLANTVWGGGFKTRLNLNLREEKGYSYGVFSFARFFSEYGVWISYGGVQTNKTKESVVEFGKELQGLAGQKPITEEELTHAKNYRVRGYAQQFESVGRITEQAAGLWAARLPMTELQREPAELEKTPLPVVNGAAERYAQPGKTSLLLVGDRAKIESGIRELNLGDLVILDPEGKPAK